MTEPHLKEFSEKLQEMSDHEFYAHVAKTERLCADTVVALNAGKDRVANLEMDMEGFGYDLANIRAEQQRRQEQT